MVSVTSEVAKFLSGRRLQDVLIPGWIDRDSDFPEFRPQPMVLWLRLDQGLVRLACEGQYDHLTARQESSAEWSDIELLMQAEDEIALASCMEQLFGDSWEELAWATVRGYETAGGTTSALAIDFEGGNTLFLDPSWTFGIRMGNKTDEAKWAEHSANGHTLHAIHSTSTAD